MSDEKSKKAEIPQGFNVRVGREKEDGWLIKTPGQVVMGRLLGHYVMKNQENDDGSSRNYFQFKLLECTNDPSVGNCHKSKDPMATKLWVPGVLANTTDEDSEDKKEKKQVILLQGDIVSVDCHAALQELIPFAKDGGVYDVYMQYMSQDKIAGKGSKTFWTMKGPILRTVTAPPPKQREAHIPF